MRDHCERCRGLADGVERGGLHFNLGGNDLLPRLLQQRHLGLPLCPYPPALGVVALDRHQHRARRVVGAAQYHRSAAVCELGQKRGRPRGAVSMDNHPSDLVKRDAADLSTAC